MSNVTVVVTSCNRPDLLKKTIDSFLAFNTYPIHQLIISEDSGIPNVNLELMNEHPEFTWINAEARRGQIRSIDEAYSHVTTDYVFHLEDDWETYCDGAIFESVKILESTPNVSAVMCRNHDDRVYHMSDIPPYLTCWGGWGYYSFNPGLRRMSDYSEFFGKSFATFTSAGNTSGLQAERKINDFYREKGYRMALTPNPNGYILHIGDNRHVEEIIKTNIKIGLCMIVKNESHIIHESLTATLPLIDTYCIVDTGSTDNTIELIKTFYEEHGIQGEVHQREWKNFGHNRSEALKLCDDKMDYILVIDADDLVSWERNGKEELIEVLRTSPNVVNFKIHQGDLVYSRMQVFKANDDWKYHGVLHEYPGNGKSNKIVDCPIGMFMTSRRLGDRNKCADKMKRDIAVFLKGLEDEPDNERYVFYLAQSYRDDGQIDEAVKWYTKRYEIGRWYEEMYMSAYNVANLTHSKEWAWKAHHCNPKRIECLVSYLSYCRMTNQFSQEVLAMALYASTVPKPTDQHLFLENSVYDWKVWDELSIIAYYCGRKDIARMASEKLITDNKAPASQMERIKNNLKFSVNNLMIDNQYKIHASRPSDINEHLPTLYEYTKKCNSIVECGVRDIVSSYAFAYGLLGNPNNSYTLIDPYKSNKIPPFLELCKSEGVNASFLEMSDITCPLVKTDLLFIDTWHVYGHLKRELAYWHSSVNKYIIMHDTTVDEWKGETIRCGLNAQEQSIKYGIPVDEITKGLWPAIEEFLKEHAEWKIEKRFTNNNGLTVLKRV